MIEEYDGKSSSFLIDAIWICQSDLSLESDWKPLMCLQVHSDSEGGNHA